MKMLDEIRQRDSAGAGVLDGTNRLVDGGLQCFKDRRWLLAEVDRLWKFIDDNTQYLPWLPDDPGPNSLPDEHSDALVLLGGTDFVIPRL